MRARPLMTALCLTLAGGPAGLVQAQDEQPLAQATGQASGQGKRSLTGSEQVAAAEELVARGTTLSKRVAGLLNEARKQNDIIAATCLNAKLTEINATLRNARRRLEALKQAVEPGRREHEYTVLTVLGQKFQNLDQEANQCAGQGMYETGPTTTETTIDQSLIPMDESPSTPPVVLPPSLPTIPPSASPVR